MDTTNIFLETISELSGGLISDLQSFYIAAGVILIVAIGIDHLKDAFDNVLDQRARDRAFDRAQEAHSAMGQYDHHSTEYAREEMRYKHWLRKSI